MLVPVVRRTTYPRIRCPAGQFFGGGGASYPTTPTTWEAQDYTATIHLDPLIWYDRLCLLLLIFPHKLTA